MRIAAYMLSCEARRESRERTLSRLRASGWTDPVFVEVDRSSHTRPQERLTATSYLLLRRALQDAPDFVLFLEDDLDFNRHFAHNLLQWAPLVRMPTGEHFFASLYNPTVWALERRPESQYLVAHPSSVYGSQALLLSIATARFIVEHWERVIGMQDIKMPTLAGELGPIYYHVPSLVQHVGVSTWGGSRHMAGDFDPSWRAATRDEAGQVAFPAGA